MTRFPVILPRALVAVVAVALVLMAVIFHGSDQALSPLYYATICGMGWWAFQGGRGPRVQAVLQSLPLSPVIRAVLLGLAAVVVEETFVGTFYALNEGLTLATWTRLVQQFITFNLFAFAGAVLGLALAVRLMPGLSRWHLLIAGGWGIFAEGSYLYLLTNPLAALMIAGPNIAAYSVIFAPLVLSCPGHDDASGRGRAPWAPLATWALMFVCALPFVLALGALRHSYPDAFPPCAYIPCDR